MRCVYAKNDPCWGYKKSENKVVCACINGDCSYIHKCNPSYAIEDSELWSTSEEDKILYGNPDNLNEYYLVDLISDKEMNRYYSDPQNFGYDYTIPEEPKYVDISERPIKSEGTIIDPLTGRKMCIVGYKKLTYPEEDGLKDPIWDYVDENKTYMYNFVKQKTKVIEKKEDTSAIEILNESKKEVEKKEDNIEYKELENSVHDNIIKEIKLTELEENDSLNDILILLENPAELSFASMTLFTSGIKHLINQEADVTLILYKDYDMFGSNKRIVVSNTVLNKGCNESNIDFWKSISKRKDVIRLNILDREYFEFKYDNTTRWTCRKLYGISHICVDLDDFDINKKLDDGIHRIIILQENDSYVAYDNNGDCIGKMNKSFSILLNSLKNSGEIEELPYEIKNVSLFISGKKTIVLGMGYLKIYQY